PAAATRASCGSRRSPRRRERARLIRPRRRPRMLEERDATASSPGIDVGAWMPRIGVGLFFVIFGLEKFDSSPIGSWVRLFEQIGIGHWFRYLTGVIEVAGGV